MTRFQRQSRRRLRLWAHVALILLVSGCSQIPTDGVPNSSIIPIAIRLSPGADLRDEIVKAAAEHNLTAGCVLTTVGSLSRARIRWAGRPEYSEIVRDLEIVSLVGTIGPDGPHLHLAVSDATGMTLGGHMGEGCIVRTTAEIVIGALPGKTFRRVHDPQTGFRELKIDECPPANAPS
jgi:uncharacterized protein